EDVDERALPEQPARGRRHRLLVLRLALAAAREAQQPEHDQVGGADELDDRERLRRGRNQSREAHGGGGHVHEPTAGDPERRDEAGAASLVDALRDDVRHGRPGHDDERQGCGGEECEGGGGRHRQQPYTRAVSPKTLTGEELQLDDAPARESELFLVDGNNLAYRAFFALPEELATTDGQPTNALLGF